MTPGPQMRGSSEDRSQRLLEKPPEKNFLQNDIRFCLEMIFPENLSLSMVVLETLERKCSFQIE
jgi:hypothetical protein